MDEKKFVTWEMFKKYHEFLVGYINEQDESILEDEVICSKCGSIINDDVCENCNNIYK